MTDNNKTNQLSVEEGNRLIAEFMGIPKCDRCDHDCGGYKYGPGNYFTPDKMRYHSSWDWLMPVVKKIMNLPIMKEKGILFMTQQEDLAINIRREVGKVRMQNSWQSVVKFIQWYNERK